MSASHAFADRIRRIILEQSRRANVGHIGSGLSVADLLAVIYADVLRIAAPDDPARDRFVLSKGHAALALYAALHAKGWIPAADLDTYCGDCTRLGVHPEHELPGVDFSTGSLGQGLSMAAGAALAARLQQSPRRVVALLSDAECNEGSTWEAIMFAAHRRLDHLTVVVDANKQQALGYTDDVLSLTPLAARWQAFGWDVQDVDGHDHAALSAAFASAWTRPGAPHAIIAHTTFGKGVSYMERRIEWHYLPMSEAQYQQALAEIGAAR
jgi:transketolase